MYMHVNVHVHVHVHVSTCMYRHAQYYSYCVVKAIRISLLCFASSTNPHLDLPVSVSYEAIHVHTVLPHAEQLCGVGGSVGVRMV